MLFCKLQVFRRFGFHFIYSHRRKKLLANLKKVTQFVQAETDILFGKIKCSAQPFKDSLAAYKCIIPFWGACHPKNRPIPPEKRWTTKIKLDVTLHEIVCMEIQKRETIHPYSDELSHCSASCYSIEEIVSEKLRALLQRNYTAPRDYYDLWYIIKNVPEIFWEDVLRAFKIKCDHKNIKFKSPDDFFTRDKTVACKQEWSNSLGYHLKNVPKFDDVLRELKDIVMKKTFVYV